MSDEKVDINQSKKKPQLQRSSNFDAPDDFQKKKEQKTRNKTLSIPSSDPIFHCSYDEKFPNNQEAKRKKTRRTADQSEENCTTRRPNNKNSKILVKMTLLFT
ncbi:hypothetical protein MXB_5049 [Myxobolus squamalis]|nr:hypothetical protein MXB_5049 [Myxobolus squamalis]